MKTGLAAGGCIVLHTPMVLPGCLTEADGKNSGGTAWPATGDAYHAAKPAAAAPFARGAAAGEPRAALFTASESPSWNISCTG